MIDPDFNPMTSPAFRADPWPILARVRAAHPVAPLSPGLVDSWSVLTHASVARVLLDPETFSSDRSLRGGDADMSDANVAWLFANMISAGGDRHRRLRMLANRGFMPKTLEALRPVLEAAVRTSMDRALQGDCDLIEDFAAPITVAMICALLGIPPEEMAQIRRWTEVLGENSGAVTWLPAVDAALAEKGRRTGIEMTDYFRRYVADRRRAPREGDLISAFLQLEVEGERLTETEVLSLAMLLLLAGNETTTNLIGNIAMLLARQPQTAAALRADPALIPGAVEEALRLHPSIRNVDRIALRDVELDGVTIPAGGLVVVWLAAANRDPAAFADPDRFDPARSGAARHLAFGYGPHLCLGAPLARMETRLVTQALVAQTKAITLIGPATRGPNANFDHIAHQAARFIPI